MHVEGKLRRRLLQSCTGNPLAQPGTSRFVDDLPSLVSSHVPEFGEKHGFARASRARNAHQPTPSPRTFRQAVGEVFQHLIAPDQNGRLRAGCRLEGIHQTTHKHLCTIEIATIAKIAEIAEIATIVEGSWFGRTQQKRPGSWLPGALAVKEVFSWVARRLPVREGARFGLLEDGLKPAPTDSRALRTGAEDARAFRRWGLRRGRRPTGCPGPAGSPSGRGRP